MIPPKGEKRHHPKTSFFSFFGNLPPNTSRDLTKKGNLNQNTDGIKNTLEVVSLFTLVKNLFRTAPDYVALILWVYYFKYLTDQ